MSTRETTQSLELVRQERDLIADAMKVRLYPFVLGRASGNQLWDVDGNSYVDWMGAAAVANVGYGHPRVRAAIDATLDREYFNVLPVFINEHAVRLADRLVNLIPGSFKKKVWFGLSGSDAMDCIAKLAPVAAGRPRLISYIGGFAGLTIGSTAISGHSAQAKTIGGGHVTKAPYPNPYRCPWGPCDAEGCSLKCLSYVEDQLLTNVSPAEDTAAIIIEAIQSDNGEIVPPANYLPALRELCDRHGIWLIFDEVKTGFGRTGRMFGFEHSGVTPDAIGLGKPLGGGMPLSAVVGRAELLDATSAFTAYTLAGAPVSCAAALATLDVIEDESLVDRAAAQGARLRAGLEELQSRYPLIGDVRGKGLMLGLELVSDPETRAPASRDAARLAYRCFELGLILIYCGSLGNVIEITPPLTIQDSEVDAGLAILDEALADIQSGRFDDSKLDDYGGW